MRRVGALLLTIALVISLLPTTISLNTYAAEHLSAPSDGSQNLLLSTNQTEKDPTENLIWDGTVAESFASGAGTSTNPYIINTASQLALLATNVNSGTTYSGKWFSLGADIYLNDLYNYVHWESDPPENAWLPIGVSTTNSFQGIFNGNGYSIYGMYVTGKTYAALFGVISNATLKNINVQNARVIGGYAAGIASYVYSPSSAVNTITNCSFWGDISSTYSRVGGIYSQYSSAWSGEFTLSNCTVKGSVRGDSYVGGIGGYGAGTISNCLVYANVAGTGSQIGGIVGYEGSNNITNCVTIGSVSGAAQVGGIIGYKAGGYSWEQVIRCANYATVTGTSEVGGIIGYEWSGPVASECYNAGIVSGNQQVGGIIGHASTSGGVKNCYNIGTISGSSMTGGIVGHAELNGAYATLSINAGTVKGSAICASTAYGGSVSNCYYQSGLASTEGRGTAVSSENMGDQSSFSTLDFSNVWEMSETLRRPVLRNNSEESRGSDLSELLGKQTGSNVDVMTHLVFSNVAYNNIPEFYINKQLSDWIDGLRATIGPDDKLYDPVFYSSAMNKLDIYETVGDWTILDIIAGEGGYNATVFQKGSDIVIAYRGTSDSGDIKADAEFAILNYLDPNQFDEALVTYDKYVSLGNVTVTGHSLGGALASYVSILRGARGYSFDGAVGHTIDLTYLFEPAFIDFTSKDDMQFTNYTDPKAITTPIADLIQHQNADLYPGICYQSNADVVHNDLTLTWTHDIFSSLKISDDGQSLEFMPISETHFPKENWYASVDFEYLGLALGAAGGFAIGAVTTGGVGCLTSTIKTAKSGAKVGRLFKVGNVILGTSGDDELTVINTLLKNKSIWDSTAVITTNVIYGGDGCDSIQGCEAADILVPGSLDGDILCGNLGNDDYLIDCSKTGYVHIADQSGDDEIILLNGEDIAGGSITFAGLSENGEWSIYKINQDIAIYILRKTNHKFTIADANRRVICTIKANGEIEAESSIVATRQPDEAEERSKEIFLSGDARLDVYGSNGEIIASLSTEEYGLYFETYGTVYISKINGVNCISATIYESYHTEIVGSTDVDVYIVGTDNEGFVEKITAAESVDLTIGDATVDLVEQTVTQNGDISVNRETVKTNAVTISEEEIALQVTDVVSLSAQAYFPDGTTANDIYWISSDPTIVQCCYDDSGTCTLTASKEGEVEVYAVARDSGLTASCTVTAYCIHEYSSETFSPTCVDQGYTHYLCSLCGNAYQGDFVPELGHQYAGTTTLPTCTAQGYTTYVCSACGETYIDDYVPANGHTPLTDERVEPTCTQTGLTEGSHCSACNQVLTEQITIDVLGHSYVDGLCQNCGDQLELYTIDFITPEGIESIATVSSWEGESVTLPAAAESRGFTFLGWTTQPVEDSSQAPAYYSMDSGFEPTESTTLYALYRYFESDTESQPCYVLITEERDDWTGEYVLACQRSGEDTLYILDGTITSNRSMGYITITSPDKQYISLENGDPYLFTIEKMQGGSDTYLLSSSGGYFYNTSTAQVYSTTDMSIAQSYPYVIGVDSLAMLSSGRRLAINHSVDYIRYYSPTGSFAPVRLYEKTNGTYFYTTEKAICTHKMALVEGLAPTCTDPGKLEHWCCKICGMLSADELCSSELIDEEVVIAATGHQKTKISTEEPTCTTTGLLAVVCADCDQTVSTEVLEMLEHSYANGECSVCGQEQIVSGICGEEAVWSLNIKTGTMTISGTGPMHDYTSSTTICKDYEQYINKVVITEGIEDIGAFAFCGYGSIQEVEVAEGVHEIWAGAFDGCWELTEIDLPSSLTYIGDDAFSNCANLREIILPNSISSLGDCAFFGCKSLEKIDIPANLSKIPDNCFECTSLTEVILPNNITEVGSCAFMDCVQLSKIVILNENCSIADGITTLGICTTVVHSFPGSTAEEYAEANSYTFHELSYFNNRNGTHNVICQICDTVEQCAEEHSFVENKCICGAEKGLFEDPNLNVYRKTMSLQSCIAFNLTVKNSILANYDSWYVVFERYDHLSGATVTETVEGSAYGTSYQLFEYKVSSYQMTDDITATLYAVKDGVTYKGEAYTDSIENFVVSRMEAAAASSADMATLYANLLTYGSKAQTYLGYNTAALADANLGGYASYVTTTAPTAEDLSAETSNGLTGATKNRLALGIAASVQIQLRIVLDSAYDVNNVYGVLSYERNGETVTQRIEGADFTVSGSKYILIFDGITAVDGRAPVNITIYDANGTAISETWTYSISSYLVNGGLTGNALATMEALLNYFDAAAKVFS